MCVPTAFARPGQFQTAVNRAVQQLRPNVVDVTFTLGNDWSGESAVFFIVILSNASTRREQLLRITNQVSNAIVQMVKPLEQWGVLPYFNFRSEAEQAKINLQSLAS
jgi:hypothetical protein